MRIITPGVLPPPPKPAWPLDKLFWCETCGCEFVISDGDTYERTNGEGGYGRLKVYCPTCDKMLTFDQESHSYGMAPGMKERLIATRSANTVKTIEQGKKLNAAPLILKTNGGEIKAYISSDNEKPCIYITINGSIASIVEYKGGVDPSAKFSVCGYTSEGNSATTGGEYDW